DRRYPDRFLGTQRRRFEIGNGGKANPAQRQRTGARVPMTIRLFVGLVILAATLADSCLRGATQEIAPVQRPGGRDRPSKRSSEIRREGLYPSVVHCWSAD